MSNSATFKKGLAGSTFQYTLFKNSVHWKCNLWTPNWKGFTKKSWKTIEYILSPKVCYTSNECRTKESVWSKKCAPLTYFCYGFIPYVSPFHPPSYTHDTLSHFSNFIYKTWATCKQFFLLARSLALSPWCCFVFSTAKPWKCVLYFYDCLLTAISVCATRVFYEQSPLQINVCSYMNVIHIWNFFPGIEFSAFYFRIQIFIAAVAILLNINEYCVDDLW